MEFILFIIIFLSGIGAGALYYKSRLKQWSNQLNDQIEALVAKGDGHKPASGTAALDQLPEELSGLINKFESALSKPLPVASSGVTEAQPDENIIGLRKVIDNLYIVNELGRKVTSSLNLQQTFNHLYTTINSMMDAAVLELTVYNESKGDSQILSNLEVTAGMDAYRNHMAEWSYKNNREVLLADAERDFGRYVFQPFILPGNKVAKSVMVFPITSGGVVSGTLSVISFQKNSFDVYHQEIIRLLLGYISVAIENALTHDELNITKIRAEQSEKFKEQFLANMSHEIRTPINAVTGMTRLLLEKEPREDQLRYLESIRNASDSLLVIINDILDLSKIEAGKIELEQIDFSISEVLKNVKEIMNFKAEEKGLLFDIKIDPSIPLVLKGDPTRLTQILINLLGNAIKFTDKGNVLLSVKEEGSSDKQLSVLKFDVTDTGIGMTEEQQGKLFRDYAQASSETSRKYGGTGLGLSISRQLVQLQGGTISVKSNLGEGSTFSFSLTYPVSKNKLVTSKEQKISAEMLTALKGIKVLLADDNEYNRIVAKETLQLKVEAVHVEEAFDGLMAIELIQKNQYDIILMDLVMPHMDGLEATRYIRENLQSPKNEIPIVAITASVIKSEIAKCIEAGMNGFIPKPFKPYEMLGAMFNALHGSNVFDLKENKPHKTVEANSNLIDLNYMNEFTEGDHVRLRRFVDLFLSKVPMSLKAISDALKQSDYERIRVAVHSIKPQLQFAGVLKGVEIAEIIEQNCYNKKEFNQLPELIDQLSIICNQASIELEESKKLLS